MIGWPRRCGSSSYHGPAHWSESSEDTTINEATVEAQSRWGIDNDYGPLRDVLLGRPEYFRWIDAGRITRRTLKNAEKMGVEFDLREAMAQHAEMVRIYEGAGVNLASLGNKRVLSMKGGVTLNRKLRDLGFEVYDPDMSMFTLGGGVHCLCQSLCRDPA